MKLYPPKNMMNWRTGRHFVFINCTVRFIFCLSRLKDFDTDYEFFFKQVETAEFGLQKYIKDVLKPIPTVTSRMLVLSRYEKLQLDCLCLDRRYLDVAVMLELEIANFKD
jgi:dynein heavy chain, axonemal